MAVIPSSLGISRSSSRTSGTSSPARAIACSPSLPSPTTSTSARCSSMNRSPCLTTVWSSTMTTRIIALLLWQTDRYTGATPRRSLYLKGALHLLDPLLHQTQSESLRCSLPGRIEALPIIRDGEDDGLLLRVQVQHDRRGMTMTDRIGQRFLGNAQQRMLGLRRECDRRESSRHREAQAGAIDAGKRFQRLGQSLVFELERAHLQQQCVQLTSYVSRRLFQGSDL